MVETWSSAIKSVMLESNLTECHLSQSRLWYISKNNCSAGRLYSKTYTEGMQSLQMVSLFHNCQLSSLFKSVLSIYLSVVHAFINCTDIWLFFILVSAGDTWRSTWHSSCSKPNFNVFYTNIYARWKNCQCLIFNRHFPHVCQGGKPDIVKFSLTFYWYICGSTYKV